MMKAICVDKAGGPEELQVRELPVPPVGRDQILVKVMAAGVNPVDTYIRAGNYPVAAYPYTPGFDAAGVVESVGAEVTDFVVGQRVYTGWNLSGAYAQYSLCHHSHVHPLPDSVSFEQGASMHVPYATAHRSLFLKARARAGQFVLIHGATGGVGLAAVQLARMAGLKIIATGGSAAGLQLLRDQGCDHVLDHTQSEYLGEITTITGGKGVDVILEMLSNVNLDRDLDILSKWGVIVVIGCRGRVEIDPRKIMGRDASILGMVLFNTPDDEMKVIHRELVAGLAQGKLVPIIGKTYPLPDASQAHVDILKPGTFGKRVLLPWA